MRRRIGLTQRADDVFARDERRDALDQQWVKLLDAAGYIPEPIPNRIRDVAGFVDALDLDLVILTGGNDLGALESAQHVAPERDALESELLFVASARSLPVLGVCRGLQTMVHHHGGALRRVDGHVASMHAVEVVRDSVWPLPNRRVVNSFHEWGIDASGLGPDHVALAFAPDGTVEAVCHVSLPQVGVMWHPERSGDRDCDMTLIRALTEAA
jgi:putative glutamine amidotransferase